MKILQNAYKGLEKDAAQCDTLFGLATMGIGRAGTIIGVTGAVRPTGVTELILEHSVRQGRRINRVFCVKTSAQSTRFMSTIFELEGYSVVPSDYAMPCLYPEDDGNKKLIVRAD